MNGLRLDKFLFFIRMAKSRSLAQHMIRAGSVRIDGARITNLHHTVKLDQILTLSAYERFRVLQVSQIPSRRGPVSEAQACYVEIVSSQAIDAPLD